MVRKSLNKRGEKFLVLDLSNCELYEGKVVGNNKFCDKIHVPFGWKGKKALVVLIYG